ncbi:hypothetical protein B0E53_07003 [Micromonospora sp. MH33]|nr:hypothetical protein B0E53_07003 [Micromonospora sp. MH33]
MVDTAAVAGAVEWVTGSVMNRLTSESTSLSRVAEKSSRWESAGVFASSRVTSGRKPMSAIWSASSSTVISTSSSLQTPRSIRSPSRPGVATTISTPRRSASICRSYGTPPTAVFRKMPTALPSGTSASLTCMASSRVGTRTRARGCSGRARLRSASRAITGRPKARVLPEPVWPRPSTSWPARASGRVARWISNGVVMPCRASASTSCRGRPSAAKSGVSMVGSADGDVPEAAKVVKKCLSSGAHLRDGPPRLCHAADSPARSPMGAQRARRVSDLHKCTAVWRTCHRTASA